MLTNQCDKRRTFAGRNNSVWQKCCISLVENIVMKKTHQIYIFKGPNMGNMFPCNIV